MDQWRKNIKLRGLWRKKKEKQKDLNNLISTVLKREPKLCYYQGFHDISSVFLLILGRKKVVNCLHNLSLFFMRDAMSISLAPIIKQLTLGMALIKLLDKELYDFLNEYTNLVIVELIFNHILI